jgi:hypothetical protein
MLRQFGRISRELLELHSVDSVLTAPFNQVRL